MEFIKSSVRYVTTAIFLYSVSVCVYAEVILPNTIISTPTTYSNTTLDMSHGNFIVKNGATLTIENSTIDGTLSGVNPSLISVELGELKLIKNQVNITAPTVSQNPKGEASFYAIRMGRSTLTLRGNTFVTDQPYTVGLLSTSVILPTKNISIINNSFEKFHGVLYLLNAHTATIDNNSFKLNSSGQIVLVGENAAITNNSLYFPGTDQLGDAIDVIASKNVNVIKNQIFTPTSIGIAITLSHDVLLDNNVITGGITYAINILSYSALKIKNNFSAKIIEKLDKSVFHNLSSTSDITIRNNYLGQNRYGLTAVDVQNLIVENNFFTQRFEDAEKRKFWTNNDILLKNIIGLTWVNNYYKEAFTQVNGGDNSMTQFVPFPVSGGVVL